MIQYKAFRCRRPVVVPEFHESDDLVFREIEHQKSRQVLRASIVAVVHALKDDCITKLVMNLFRNLMVPVVLMNEGHFL